MIAAPTLRTFLASTRMNTPREHLTTLWDAHQAFAETEPTTLAGLLAMLIYAGEIAERGDREVFHEVDIFPTIATAAKTLSGRSA